MLRKIWQKWLQMARSINRFNVWALMTILYFAILALFDLSSRFLSDPLAIKKRPGENAWQSRLADHGGRRQD